MNAAALHPSVKTFAAFTIAITALHGCGGGDLPAPAVRPVVAAAIDPVFFQNGKLSYVISRTGTGYNVADKTSGVVVAVSSGTPKLVFADSAVLFDPTGTAGQAYRLYQAAFHRSADMFGLGYWISVLESGASLTAVAAGFLNSAEFSTTAALDNRSFVQALYRNVLLRDGESSGVDFWTDHLDAQHLSRADVLAQFSESAENHTNIDPSVQQGITYVPRGLSGLTAPDEPIEPACQTTLSGVVGSSHTYSASAGPYCISGSLQIPAGVTATFEAGSSIRQGSIVVQGALSLAGAAGSRVHIEDVQIKPAGLIDSKHSIKIAYTDVVRGTLYAPWPNLGYGSLTLTDSRVTDLGSYIYLWYPSGANLIARNVFVHSGGISYGLTLSGTNGVSLTIANNYFSGWTSTAALENWAQYSNNNTQKAEIRGNTFATTSKIAVSLPAGYTSAAMDASGNYWGTSDETSLLRMIYDKRVDITSGGLISYSPFLTAADPMTPTP